MKLRIAAILLLVLAGLFGATQTFAQDHPMHHHHMTHHHHMSHHHHHHSMHHHHM